MFQPAGSSPACALALTAMDTPHRLPSDEEFAHEYSRLRDEHGSGMDADYRRWRSDRFEREFGQWRAIRAAQAGLRTGSGPPITHGDRERELDGSKR